MSIGEKMTFWGLINSSEIESIEIPQIQRDYVQGRHTPQIDYSRERLIAELRDAIETGKRLDLNFVYGKDVNKVFVPIDGQQRLTTLLSLHVYAFAKEGKEDELDVLKNKFTYLTRTSTQRFLEELIDHFAEFFGQDELEIDAFIKDSAWYSLEWEKDPSVTSFLVVLKDIDRQFNAVRNLSDKLMDPNCAVSFMALKITEVGLVNDLYITMNSRGKALTEFETFKSELFDYLETSAVISNISEFKKKSDNEWLSMIWDLCAAPERECDTVYMSFLHRIIMNRLIAGRYNTIESKHWDNLNANNGFYNFADYKPYLSDGKVLRDVYATFELCYWLIQNGCGLKTSQRIAKSEDLNYAEQVQLVALTKYAIDVPKTAWTTDSWNAWDRVITNLIHNTEIDKIERFIRAANSIYSMDAKAPENAYSYFAAISPKQIEYFNDDQVEEEILKCKLIMLDKDWLATLMKAEENSYFEGRIQFALTLSNITNADPSLDQKTQQDNFKETWKIIELVFDSKSPTKLCVNDSLFRRGLLTYGDYSTWANSSYILFFEGGKGYFNWRRMLKDSISVFSRLFLDLKAQGVTSPAEIDEFLEKAIVAFSDKSDELIYYMIKIPAVLDFMREKRFRRYEAGSACERNILYSGARLSKDYAEAYSYFAFCKLSGTDNEYHYGKGTLNSPTTHAYIEKVNGKRIHIAYDYEQKCFCDENGNGMKNAADAVISTVEELLASL